MTSTWLAPPRATIADLPPTRPELATALRGTHRPATTFAGADR